ncbi:class I SAM-dependent methyltransferase [Rhizobium mayense]|uniref:Class I SAM-dependent methyltransferase n=1 Tax=Rhizobium mayense TaxID=1312184 RepID=A0ABT7K0J5_9HYPH|nr:class I SAM-dependent methyltransferase [Rhizobium mayense]MDL2401672.1 class I SAM-dependent methyltransferase [Rhizobium mayense]
MTTTDTVLASPYEGLAFHYNDTRPSYPVEAIADLSGTRGIVVDVGAGTGIFTRQLAGLLPEADVVGIEPSADMRGMAEAASGQLGNIAFMAGSAEKLPFADASVAVVTAATAVHWFKRSAFYAEAFRCLGDSGRLVIVQNIRRWWDSEWLGAYEELHESIVNGYRRGTFPAFDGQYRALDVAAELSTHQLASSIVLRDFEWRTLLSKKDFVSFSLSSTITQRAVAAIGKAAYLDQLERLLQAHSRNGTVEIDYVTRVVIAMRAERPDPRR